jgi:O-antigen/teichoic acid export membrane protein
MLRNSVFSLVTTVLRLLGSLVLFIVMAHEWGPRLFGIFMYPYAITAILIRLVDYGFALQLMRDIGRSPSRARDITGQALSAKAALVVPTIVAAAIVCVVLPHENDYRILFAILLCDTLANSFALFLNVPLRALGRFDVEAYVVTAGNVAVFAVVTIMVACGSGPVPTAIALLLARLGYLCASWVLCLRLVGGRPRAQWSLPPLLSTLMSGFPFAVHATVGTLVAQADTLLVQHYLGAQGVGVYQAGVRILLGALLVADALNNVYLAAFASIIQHPAEVARLGTRMTRHLLTLGVLAFLCTFGGSHWIVNLVFSDGYEQLVGLLPLFGLLMLVRYGGVSYGTLLTLADKQATRALAVIGALGVSIVANVLLIPRSGLTGAIWATIITHVTLYAIYVAATWKDHRTLLLSGRSLALVGIAGLTGLLLFVPITADRAIRLQLGIALGLTTAFIGVTRSEWVVLSRKIGRLTLARAG